MKVLIKTLILGWLIVPIVLIGQIDNVAVVGSNHPDFGGVSGTWGHMQFYRPFGMRAIILDDWKNLATFHPISGEPINTDRQGWLPISQNQSIWSQLHPDLTTPADTTAPSLLVNYKQGDGDYQDFTIWYHNSLGDSTRFGWTSKLRSHQRYSLVTPYDEQRHRLQLEHRNGEQSLKVEIGYDHQLNPFYMYEFDTTALVWNYNDALQIRSDRFDGSLHWQKIDSLSLGTELFIWSGGAIWDRPFSTDNSFSTLAIIGHRFQVSDWSPFGLKAGIVTKQIGGDKYIRNILEFNLPEYLNKNFRARLGIRNIGKSIWAPRINFSYTAGPISLNYKTHHMVVQSGRNSFLDVVNLNNFQTSYSFSRFELFVDYWQAKHNNQSLAGYSGELSMNMSWKMQMKIGGSHVEGTSDWIWSENQVNWEIDQGIVLFNEALYGNLRIWGRHLIEPRKGFLNSESLLGEAIDVVGTEDISRLDLLNYTIYGQVSTLILAYTDSNILQDPLWTQYSNVNWDADYLIMSNQLPQTRFRYLSLIWVFDN